MLESGLFFALGFFVAVLIALLIAPSIWRRAVYLTQKRIENSVPLSLDEIQASKDQLRAKFARDTRKLEISLEKARNQSAGHLIELNRRRDEMQSLTDLDTSHKARVSELEATNRDISDQLRKREERLSETESRLAQIEASYRETSTRLQELEDQYQGAIDEFDGQKIEMVARETRMDTLQDELREAKKTAKELGAERNQFINELKTASSAFDKEQARSKDLSAKLADLQAIIADMEGRLERRESDLKKLRGKTGASQLDAILRENESLLQEIESLRKRGHNAGADQSDIAAVRDQISELAARVTAAAAAQEGPDSQINAALNSASAKSGKSPAKGKTTATKKTAAKSKTKTAGGRKPKSSPASLADRIKELQ